MFAPVVIRVCRILGKARFTRLRARAISLHTQVITQVCDRIGIHRSQRQQLIRLARDNGKRLGLMA
ncbi:MAG: electron transporter [Leptolyngbya sp. SIO1E4]|nr:electron transporter [Leptolyngbya sp. SIO1E4]